MIITKKADRWIVESETQDERDFIHEVFNVNDCVTIHIPRGTIKMLVDDIRIRKVRILKGRAKEEAEKNGLKPDDLVIVTTKYSSDSLPEYHIEKIVGDPISYLFKRVKEL